MISSIMLVLVGPQPPPVHGMAAVNSAVRDALRQIHVDPQVIDLAAPSLDRSLKSRLHRLPKVLRGLVQLSTARPFHGMTLYISISGGFGQLYELVFIMLARMRGMKLYLHHHSFAYLDRPSHLTRVLTKIAGTSATHITQSAGMSARLTAVYGIKRVLSISNAVFFLSAEASSVVPRRQLQTLGFISNITEEKGVFEYLDLMAAVQIAGLPVRAKLAGPFQDTQTESRVRARLDELSSVEYVGPKYGAEKDAFFASIDTLCFPTRNEAEPLVLHEAMIHGIPIVAYGRGCIPEIAGPDCGLVIDPGQPFVPAALVQIKHWLADPAAFEKVSKAAAERFARTYADSQARWLGLLGELTGQATVPSTANQTGNR